MKKYVYSFNEGSKDMWSLLGGKGANLAEMTQIGLPVPFGFTVTTEVCGKYCDEGQKIDEEIIGEIHENMEVLENVTGKKFGDLRNPLLVSVRSGSAYSMPGMMDTILNLGLNDDTVESLARLTENERFAYDSYRRFIRMYGEVVLGIHKSEFDAISDRHKVKTAGEGESDGSLQADALKVIIQDYKVLVKNKTGEEFPQEPEVQLLEAIRAVFRSWNNERAILYRRIHHIPEELGTAVNVQAMVFGNLGENSCTGAAFTRDPSTGERRLYGEFLINAQGEDIVAGIRKPNPIEEMEHYFPECYKRFGHIAEVLEKHFKDVQDMQFTIENGKLYMLQARPAKRTMVSTIKTAVDMVGEGLITKEMAIERINPYLLDQLLHPAFDEEAESEAEILDCGLAASPGAASGKICFFAADAEKIVSAGEPAVLVRQETLPEDLAGIVAAEGIITGRGGITSHAAVVARGMGKCCVTGCSGMKIDEAKKTITVGNQVLNEGDYISLNGSTGHVYCGRIKSVQSVISPDFTTVMSWADEIRTLKIRANADNAGEAEQALRFGAEGIGLCRTEHMFFDDECAATFRCAIFAATKEERNEYISKLLPLQKAEFKRFFEIMEDKPVTIRLLDPPLHEFLPQNDAEIEELAEYMESSFEQVKAASDELRELNPMLGHRGCRLTISYPEITVMQTRAIMEAAIEVSKEKGVDVSPEIMIPLIGNEAELAQVKSVITETANRCRAELCSDMEYYIGTMIEVPRAAMTADKIAREVDFFSFGTNDLTQMVLGLSRDDTGDLIREYVERGIYKADPFQTIDQEGVGVLMEMAVKLGRQSKVNMRMGICGEHGGDPASIEFCQKLGLGYVSCSPFRIPIAQIAAAQAVIKDRSNS